MKAMLATLLLATCMSTTAFAEETDKHPAGAPGDYELVLENDSVQVLRIRIASHEKTPMHDVTPRVVVWLADARFIDSFPDGSSREELRKKGDVEWVSARRHAGENLSETPMEFIAVVLKSPAPLNVTSPPDR